MPTNLPGCRLLTYLDCGTFTLLNYLNHLLKILTLKLLLPISYTDVAHPPPVQDFFVHLTSPTILTAILLSEFPLLINLIESSTNYVLAHLPQS